jgi:hypothetical protein
MNRASLLLFTSFFLTVAGCATDEVSDDGAPNDDELDPSSMAEDALTAGPNQQKAILEGLRVRVSRDFANVASLKNHKIVFIVRTEGGRLKTNGSKSFVRAVFVKRGSDGTDARLSAADYKKSTFEDAIEFGAFDCPLSSPQVNAVLKKGDDGKWRVDSAGGSEGYSVCPTDVAFLNWDKQFDIPRKWVFP